MATTSATRAVLVAVVSWSLSYDPQQLVRIALMVVVGKQGPIGSNGNSISNPSRAVPVVVALAVMKLMMPKRTDDLTRSCMVTRGSSESKPLQCGNDTFWWTRCTNPGRCRIPTMTRTRVSTCPIPSMIHVTWHRHTFSDIMIIGLSSS
jgi:hypothetical protein